MIDIIKALNELGVNSFVIHGNPTTEEEFNSMFRVTSGVNDEGTAIEIDNPSKWGVTWSEVIAKKNQLITEEPLRLLREERDKALVETDWWVLPDRTPTQAQLEYRQALRDITKTYSSLDDVVWPAKPTE